MENLEKLGVLELKKKEIKLTNGGILGIDDIIVGVVVGATLAIISDWENFKAGLSGKPPIK